MYIHNQCCSLFYNTTPTVLIYHLSLLFINTCLGRGDVLKNNDGHPRAGIDFATLWVRENLI